MNNTKLFEVWRRYLDGEEEKTVINERMDPGGSTGGSWTPSSSWTSVPPFAGQADPTPDLCDIIKEVSFEAIPGIIEAWYFHGKIKSKAARSLVSNLFGSRVLGQGARQLVRTGLGGLISAALLGHTVGQMSKNPACIKLFKQLYEYFATNIQNDLTPEEQEELEKRMQFFGEQDQEEWNRLDETAKKELKFLLATGPQAEV